MVCHNALMQNICNFWYWSYKRMTAVLKHCYEAGPFSIQNKLGLRLMSIAQCQLKTVKTHKLKGCFATRMDFFLLANNNTKITLKQHYMKFSCYIIDEKKSATWEMILPCLNNVCNGFRYCTPLTPTHELVSVVWMSRSKILNPSNALV